MSNGWNLIPAWICCFFLFCSAVNFFCFSLLFLYTVSLKLSDVNFTILFWFPASSTWLIGWVLSRFLMTVFRLILASSSMVAAIFCISSSSPGSPNPLITRHGRRDYCSWLSIFVWRRLLTVWVMWIWLSSSEIFPSKSSTFFRR